MTSPSGFLPGISQGSVDTFQSKKARGKLNIFLYACMQYFTWYENDVILNLQFRYC